MGGEGSEREEWGGGKEGKRKGGKGKREGIRNGSEGEEKVKHEVDLCETVHQLELVLCICDHTSPPPHLLPPPLLLISSHLPSSSSPHNLPSSSSPHTSPPPHLLTPPLLLPSSSSPHHVLLGLQASLFKINKGRQGERYGGEGGGITQQQSRIDHTLASILQQINDPCQVPRPLLYHRGNPKTAAHECGDNGPQLHMYTN